MKKIVQYLLPVLLVFFQTQVTYSQPQSFVIANSYNYDETGYDILELADEESYIVCGSKRKVGSSRYQATFYKFNEEGSITDSAMLSFSNKSIYMHDILSGYGDSLIFSGIQFDTGQLVRDRQDLSLLLFITDLSLNPIDTLFYPYPIPKNFYIILNFATKLSNNNIAVLGSISDTLYEVSRPKFFFYEISENFDPLRFVYWPDSAGSGQDVKILPNGDYWVLLDGLKSWQAHYYVFDSAFNVLSLKRVPNRISDPFGVKWDSDSTFYIVGEWDDGPDDDIGFSHQWHDNYDEQEVNKFNSWGTQDTLDYPAFQGGLDFMNKDSIFIGGVSYWRFYLMDKLNYFFIIQTDSLLNVRWEKFYGGDAYYTMLKLIATSDGGCISTGSRYDYLNSTLKQADLFVLKIDSEGIITHNEEYPSLKVSEAIIYPNPGTSEIKVRIAAQHTETLFQLFDINGKLVASEQIFGKWGTINTNFLKSGTYIYRITSKQGLFESGKWVKK